MESSGEQALIIGVNVFILVIALTCAIMLMTTVLNMSNAANTVIKTTTDSSLMTLYGGTNERVYTGSQVLAIIEGYRASNSNMQDKYYITINGAETTISNEDMLKAKYSLEYGRTSDGKVIYNFEKIEEIEVETE